MNAQERTSGFGAFWYGAFGALQWRLLLLWVLGLCVPTAIVAIPFWRALAGQIDHSVHAGEWLARLDLGALYDAIPAMQQAGYTLNSGFMLGLAITVMLSPWLTGMSVVAARSPRPLGFAALLQGGLGEYGRMFRLMLWSVLPLALALAAIGGMLSWAADKGDHAILESEAEHASRIALLVGVFAFVLMHATVEAARAQFAADAQLRSAIRAWWRGLKLVLRRPFSTLGVYVVLTALGLLAAALFGWGRINVLPLGATGIVLGLLLTQAGSAALGWMRSARLFALMKLVAR
ncbi:hypothetical protein [Arenimonas sp.]|uniref:hypothetical protein n=1 Tax=Arenimonas sp. TaxID=1872635 RepID=UPI0039E33548